MIRSPALWLSLPALLLLAIPFATLLGVTPWHGFHLAWGDGGAIAVSLGLGGLALMIVVALGLPVAWWLAWAKGRRRLLVEILVLLPLLTPPLAMGILLISAWGPYSLAGEWLSRFGLTLVNNPGAFVLAQVYGSLPLEDTSKLFTEETPLAPNSPYAASKTGGDLLARAYHHTFGMDIVTTRCSNNFGPYQFPEKVIPLFVTNLIEGKKVPLYGDGLNVRDWLHVDDHCEAILAVLERGISGEVYNVGGNNERSNLELTHSILGLMGCGEEMIEYVSDRPGHDLRYAIDASKIKRELGWVPTRSACRGRNSRRNSGSS